MPVMPMILRGLENLLPIQKVLYIMKDSSREARLHNVEPFGLMCDPVRPNGEGELC